jgi:hypothetical protein
LTPAALADFAFRAGRLDARARVLTRTAGRPDVIGPRERDALVDGWEREFVAMHEEAAGDLLALDVLASVLIPTHSPEGDLERMRPASELPC